MMLENKLGIFHPHLFTQFAEKNFSQFAKQLITLTAYEAKNENLQEFINYLGKMETPNLSELEEILQLLTEWKQYSKSTSSILPAVNTARWQQQEDFSQEELRKEIENWPFNALCGIEEKASLPRLSQTKTSFVNNLSKISENISELSELMPSSIQDIDSNVASLKS